MIKTSLTSLLFISGLFFLNTLSWANQAAVCHSKESSNAALCDISLTTLQGPQYYMCCSDSATISYIVTNNTPVELTIESEVEIQPGSVSDVVAAVNVVDTGTCGVGDPNFPPTFILKAEQSCELDVYVSISGDGNICSPGCMGAILQNLILTPNTGQQPLVSPINIYIGDPDNCQACGASY